MIASFRKNTQKLENATVADATQVTTEKVQHHIGWDTQTDIKAITPIIRNQAVKNSFICWKNDKSILKKTYKSAIYNTGFEMATVANLNTIRTKGPLCAYSECL